MKNSEIMFSSKTDEWSTPQSFFDKLNAEFNFNLDPAATDINHKCSRYFTAKEDGLTQNWGGVEYFVTRLIARLRSGREKRLLRLNRTTLS